MKKKTLLLGSTLAALGITGAVLLNGGAVQALADNHGLMSGDTFIASLANKLGKSETEVRTAIGEINLEREAAIEEEKTNQLTDAVAAGEITNEQKTLIEAKLNELKTQREAERATREAQIDELRAQMENMTEAERQAKFQELRQQMKGPHHEESLKGNEHHLANDLESWAAENNIDWQVMQRLINDFGRHGHDQSISGSESMKLIE